MILGNIITSIISPFAKIFGYILAGFYSFTHSFGLSIVLLTLASMIVAFPLTRASTRSMMRMQLLQPQLLKIRNKHKINASMTAEEKQAARLALNEEMMALYRENGVNPTGGCLPMLLQFPIFIVLYNVIRGMTRTVTIGKSKVPVLQPEYVPRHTQLYHALLTSNGKLSFLGLNLADSVRSPGSVVHKLPYVLIILVAVGLQYVSIWQITNRNPAAAGANAQMQAVQKFMPLIFVVIYIEFPAGVALYFVVSSLFRIGQQEYMYKHDPKIVASVKEIRTMRAIDATAKKTEPAGKATKAAPGSSRGLRDRLRDAATGFQGGTPELVESTGAATGNGAAASVAPNRPASGKSAGKTPSKPAPNVQNRSRAKRRRRP